MVGVGRMCLGPSGPPQLRRTSPPPGLLPRVCSHCMLGESHGSIGYFSKRLLGCVHTRVGRSEYQLPCFREVLGLIFFSGFIFLWECTSVR